MLPQDLSRSVRRLNASEALTRLQDILVVGLGAPQMRGLLELLFVFR